MKKIIVLFVTFIALSSQAVSAAPKVKKEIIVVEGKLGTIKEERVKSVQSNISYQPANGAASYDLIDLTNSGTEGHSEHIESEQITIPSWTLFSW